MKFILDKIYQNNYFWILLVITTIAYPFYFIQYGIDFTDTFFHFNNVEQYKFEGTFVSSMTFLSTYIMHIWSSLFGNTIISYRVLNMLLSVSILFLPLLYFKKLLNAKYFLIYVFAASISYVAILKSNIGYDSISDFFIINATFSFVLFLNSYRKAYLILVSFFFALATASRLPDILILPLIVFILFLLSLFKVKSWSQFFINTTLFLLASCLFYILVVYLFFGSLEVYFESYNNKNLNSTYSIFSLVLKYYFSAVSTLKILFFLVIFIILYKIPVANQKGMKLKNSLLVLALFSYYLIVNFKNPHFYSLSWSFSAVLVIISFLIITDKNVTKKDKILLLFFALVSIIPAMGSNMGLLKAIPMSLIPFILVFYKVRLLHIINKILLVIVCFSLVERFNNTYDDKPFNELNYSFNNKLLKGIKSSKSRTEGINEVELKIQSILDDENNHVEFFGMNSHVYNAISGISSEVSYSFERSFNNEKEILLYENYLNNNKTKNIYFIVNNKFINAKGEEFESSKFLSLMNKFNYKRNNFSEFVLFEPNKINSL